MGYSNAGVDVHVFESVRLLQKGGQPKQREWRREEEEEWPSSLTLPRPTENTQREGDGHTCMFKVLQCLS